LNSGELTLTIETVDTVIVGGGQAGLSVAYYCKVKGLSYVVLEKSDQPAYAWREEKWDSFCLVTPNWTVRLPGGNYEDFGFDPNGFILRDEIVDYLEKYIKLNNLNLSSGFRVTRIYQDSGQWIVEGNKKNEQYKANNIVIATGFFQNPKIPSHSINLQKTICQIHTSKYKNPSDLNDGAVLVIGSGQSGMQIAEELYKSGKKVHLSVGSTGRIPRRYRGKDTVYWWERLGMFTKPVESLESPKDRFGSNPHVSGAKGGHDLNIHQFYRDGVSLYGHLDSISSDGKIIYFKDDLRDLITKIDEFEKEVLIIIDDYIEKNSIKAEEDKKPRLTDAYNQKIIRNLDIEAENITNIIWGTGYERDYSLIEGIDPIVDEMGFPVQKKGVSPHRGLYFVGMPWISNAGSGLFYGVGSDAKNIVDNIIKQKKD
jgi:putative flavoprotein involved in K+ transport